MSGMSSSESGTTTTIELMSDSPSHIRLPLKSDNPRVDDRTDAEIIDQQAYDVFRHYAWNQCRATVENAHETWREAAEIERLQALELQALNAATTEARRIEWVAASEATRSRIFNPAVRDIVIQSQAAAASEATHIESAAASEATRFEHATVPMITEDQQQADQRWRDSDEGQAQVGILDDIFQSLSTDNDMNDMLTSMTLGPTAFQDPLRPTRTQNVQEPNLQIVQPHQSDPALPSTRSYG